MGKRLSLSLYIFDLESDPRGVVSNNVTKIDVFGFDRTNLRMTNDLACLLGEDVEGHSMPHMFGNADKMAIATPSLEVKGNSD